MKLSRYVLCSFIVVDDPSTTEIYTYCHTLSLPVALPIYVAAPVMAFGALQFLLGQRPARQAVGVGVFLGEELGQRPDVARSEEHTSELQSLMRNAYAVICLKKKQYFKVLIIHS